MEDLNQMEAILKVLFWHRPVQNILEKGTDALIIRKQEFVTLANSYTGTAENNQYTKEELGNQWLYYCDRMREERERRGASTDQLSGDAMNPMDCVFFYVKNMLTIQNNEVVCRYKRLLEWQMLTLDISENLLVSAFWAIKKEPQEMTEHEFSWKLVLGHDNYQLNCILGRKLAENHFHLYGSAPVFHLSWLSLMNNPLNAKAAKKLNEYDKNRMNTSKHRSPERFEMPLRLQHYQAALIRLLLFSEVSGRRIRIGSYRVCVYDCKEWLDIMRFQEEYIAKKEDKRSQKECSIKDDRFFWKEYGSNLWLDMEELETKECVQTKNYQNFVEQWRTQTLRNVRALLREGNTSSDVKYNLYQLQEEIVDIQNTIDALRYQARIELPDYALLEVPNQYTETNEIFEGERWLLHACFRRIYCQNFEEYEDLFYSYLLLKETVRHELIQTDDKAGFSHFQDYERRKFDLLDDAIFHGVNSTMAITAVSENLMNPKIRSLEIRLTPGETAEEDLHLIKRLDRIIGGKRKKYYYTVHFLKREDNWKTADPNAFYHRHYELRRKIQKQANALVEMRERYPDRAEQILGIDAASKEIVCRPEVFATIFRFLHSHTKLLERPEGKFALPQLRRTFHVGEEFEDLVDGLRAIDEAINFLELENGDRIGHALALGINTKDWYTAKNFSITISKQDYLDNIMWLYHQLVRFKLAGTEALKEYLKNEFNVVFNEVYLKHINQEVIFGILLDYNKHQTNQYKNTHENNQLSFDIVQYYRAWKLRGDSPELYREGYFSWLEGKSLMEDSKVTRHFPRHFEVRNIPEAFILNYLYHYNLEIRKAGAVMVKKKIEPFYIEGANLVQKEMQREIGRRGIAIETNPTSNFKISTFNRYDRHPILTYYNRELETDSEKLEQCPQLLVSINTDDQGIFSTSLENEYSLMACALEKARDTNGRYLYPKQRVYAWLDAVRKMGLEQSFQKQESDDKDKKENSDYPFY